MSDATHMPLIEQLAGSLAPVRRLPAPWRRAGAWLGAAAWIGLLLLPFADLPALGHRMMATPDMGLSMLGAALTAALAALAAFETSVPGRSPAWALLPLPALGLWVGASTMGCLRLAPAAATVPEPAMHPMFCMYLLLLVALPLALLLAWLVRRAYPLRPGLTALLAGLASAGAAATLLTLVHPYDATADDLLAHLAAVLAILGFARFQRLV